MVGGGELGWRLSSPLLWKTETAYCKQSSEQCVGRPESEARLELGVLGFGSWQLPALSLYFCLLISKMSSLHNWCIMYDLWHKCRCTSTATALMLCVFLMAALHHCSHFLNHILCCWLDSHLF